MNINDNHYHIYKNSRDQWGKWALTTKNFREKFLTSRQRRPVRVGPGTAGHKKLAGEVLKRLTWGGAPQKFDGDEIKSSFTFPVL
ncbi:hypothetical protein RBA71_18910 [Brenneria goodwinii]|uniref:hypothetical protein n=1 Tax=Brenneria goodwinii TaxID=1109412 RepID=UPI0036EE17BC